MTTETKRCSKCGISKALTEFYKDKHTKDGLTILCKDCDKRYSRDRRSKINVFKRFCQICGYRETTALCFHHKDPKTKSFEIGSSDYTYQKMLDEIAKCVVLCSNCHRTFHHYEHNPSERPKFLLKKYLKLGLKITKEQR